MSYIFQTLHDLESFVFHMVKRNGGVFEVQWFTPDHTIEALNALTAKGYLRHDTEVKGWYPERYVAIKQEEVKS